MKNYTGDLTIIILNFNTADWVAKCFTSLKKYYLDKTKKDIQVVMVDNNSSDDSATKIKQQFPWVKVLQSESNLGFAGGNNIALEKLKTRYAMLLNSDTEFTPGSNLDTLIEYLDEHRDVAAITPRLQLPTGEVDPASHRGEPTLWASFTYFAKLEELFPASPIFGQYHQTYKDFNAVHQVDACSGAAMIVRTSVIEEVGLLNDRFFMYAEDLDWCKRFRDAGYKIIYHPFVTIVHHKYKSGLKNTDQKLSQKTHQYFYQTMLQYYDKHYQKRYPRFVRWLIKAFISLKIRRA